MVLQSLLLASRPIRLRTPILRRCGIFARIPRGRRIRRQAMACGDLMRGLAYDRGRLVAFIRRARRLRVVACTSVIGSRFGSAVLTKRTLHHTGFALGRFRNGGFFGDGCGIFTATAVATPPRAAAPTAASTAAIFLTTCRGLAGLAADRLSVGRGGGRLRSDGDGRHRHGCFLYGRRADGPNFGLCRGGEREQHPRRGRHERHETASGEQRERQQRPVPIGGAPAAAKTEIQPAPPAPVQETPMPVTPIAVTTESSAAPTDREAVGGKTGEASARGEGGRGVATAVAVKIPQPSPKNPPFRNRPRANPVWCRVRFVRTAGPNRLPMTLVHATTRSRRARRMEATRRPLSYASPRMRSPHAIAWRRMRLPRGIRAKMPHRRRMAGVRSRIGLLARRSDCSTIGRRLAGRWLFDNLIQMPLTDVAQEAFRPHFHEIQH